MSQLKKDLTLSQLTMIAIGSCIGSGIFITPAKIVAEVPNYLLALLVWGIGGLITFLGAMTFSELGSRYPKAGGVYVYLKEAYGEMAGFLYGWIILLIVNTGALGALSMGLADYLSFFFELSDHQKTIIAIGIILTLTIINIFGVKTSGRLAQIFTGLKLLAIAVIIIVGLSFGDMTHFQEQMTAINQDKSLMQAMLLALVGVFWSFGGWHHATYLSGEVKNPKRSVPRAMIIGTLTVTIIYLLANLAFMFLLPGGEMAASKRVAGDALVTVYGFGGKAVAVAIIVSIIGTISIYTMTAPRIYYSMAKDGIFFKSLSTLHPRFKTPYIAMLFQAFWAIVLLLIWGSFYKMITFVVFMDIVFMTLAAGSIFVFRSRDKEDTEVPFKLSWYPIIPLVFVLITIAFVFNTMISLNKESFAGIGILLLGIPVYYWFKKRKGVK